ncbi:hypothetical protein DPSP01_012322 [Paraphaeosphaeria sporulosa]
MHGPVALVLHRGGSSHLTVRYRPCQTNPSALLDLSSLQPTAKPIPAPAMADQLLEQVRDAMEGQIDFEGQRLAELLTNVLLGAVGIFAFFIGFMAQDITLTLYIGLAGTLVTFLAVVPPWPFYNKNPEGWLPAHVAQAGVGGIDVDGLKVG